MLEGEVRRSGVQHDRKVVAGFQNSQQTSFSTRERGVRRVICAQADSLVEVVISNTYLLAYIWVAETSYVAAAYRC